LYNQFLVKIFYLIVIIIMGERGGRDREKRKRKREREREGGSNNAR